MGDVPADELRQQVFNGECHRTSTSGRTNSAPWMRMRLSGQFSAAVMARGPSSEKLLHLACYKGFDDIKSVIHAHPVYATMFAVAHEPLPACIDEFSIFVGGAVAVTDYAMSMRADPRAYYGYYFWQVIYGLRGRLLVLPVGFPKVRPLGLTSPVAPRSG